MSKAKTSENNSEKELAKIVVDWLRADHWEVFEEISPWGGSGRRADIVARRGAVVWVVETKRQFNLELLEQASDWQFNAHFVSLAVWKPKSQRPIVYDICRKFGLGFISVSSSVVSPGKFDVYEHCEGAFNRRAESSPIVEMLGDDTAAKGNAGSTSHKFFTPFKRTCQNLVEVARREPGIVFDLAVKKIKHHYADHRKALINLKTLIEKGVIPELEIERRKHYYFLYAVGDDGEKITEAPAVPTSTAVFIKPRTPVPVQIDLFGLREQK